MNTRDVPRKRRPVELAGKPKNQEAARKVLVHELRVFGNEQRRRALKALRAADVLDSVPVDEITLNRNRTRNALHQSLCLDDSRLLWAVRRLLLGPSYDTQVDRHDLADLLFDWSNRSAQADSATPRSVAPASRKGEQSIDQRLSPEAVLADALRIVAAASDADIDDIDWTENPKSERERALRLAIIRRIETENQETGSVIDVYEDGRSYAALYTVNALRRLAPSDAPEIGEDLYDAIERWEVAWVEQRKRNATLEKRRLLDRARGDLDGTNDVA